MFTRLWEKWQPSGCSVCFNQTKQKSLKSVPRKRTLSKTHSLHVGLNVRTSGSVLLPGWGGVTFQPSASAASGWMPQISCFPFHLFGTLRATNCWNNKWFSLHFAMILHNVTCLGFCAGEPVRIIRASNPSQVRHWWKFHPFGVVTPWC